MLHFRTWADCHRHGVSHAAPSRERPSRVRPLGSHGRCWECADCLREGPCRSKAVNIRRTSGPTRRRERKPEHFIGATCLGGARGCKAKGP